ncbi:hypothetical protein [Halonotius roseus]|uniref:DUF86 domain-containing protein n=1 Tax=Halonotius roseus TaxID=2511997 RepID=A0A544QR17_9EURY|nr:hypothetical protein [Halonotius roseus]TQQ81886.1 hypothetical protein EWF95_02810 [Halonotius roseus]
MQQNDSNNTFKDEYDGSIAEKRLIVSDPNRINKNLAEGNIDIALLLTATKTEAILRNKLIQYFEIHTRAFSEVCGNKTLGWYIDKCNEKEIIDKQHREAFDDLKQKRNLLTHEYGYITQLQQNEEEMEEVKNIIEDCCDWFDSIHQHE